MAEVTITKKLTVKIGDDFLLVAPVGMASERATVVGIEPNVVRYIKVGEKDSVFDYMDDFINDVVYLIRRGEVVMPVYESEQTVDGK